MKKIIEEIIDNKPEIIKSKNKDIPDIINYLKSIQKPEDKSKEEIKPVKKNVEPKETNLKIKNEYNENEKKWLKIFENLGGEVNE